MHERRSRQRRTTMRGALSLLTASALALVAVACGSDKGSGGAATTTVAAPTSAASTTTQTTQATGTTPAATTTTKPAATPEKAKISLGILPIADVAPVFIAIKNGLFAAEGLEVSTEFAQGGAATIPALSSGDLDIGFGAYPSFFSAVSQGLPLKIISEAPR